ncbi:branched-chain amino acid transaminase [Helicobacter muridarum]|uniref:Branched-chain-amino-acid aminotransferase n=1 Tax=Helicobacter muridarum TaxID=216 RepID=A0A099U094_9HELI|nr:branched-chain amino acid transaminase [Helicobacter muridarum]TLE00839.1 branched-chain amino acid transaminase [Helicobacter muridarum]STQ86603.1 branched-chain amino acid aminotransferase [Helicobacter muridarum]
MKEAKYIWKNGKLVPWKDATTHILSHTLHYGNGVFEGTRAYMTKNGLAIFRLDEHTQRLLDSAKIVMIKCPYSKEELKAAQIELLKANKECFNKNVYIRPIIYLGYGAMGVYHLHSPVEVAIASWEWGAYLGDEALQKGIRVKVSSFVRSSVKSTMGKAKAVANYLNSQMAKHEAIACGFEEALLLDDNGFIAEGSGECLFIVRNGKIIAPPYDNSLESITHNTVFCIAKDMGLEIEQRRVTRDEIYVSDEAFFTGTAAEITPICEVDFRVIGSGQRGEITKKIQDVFFEIVTGNSEKYKHFLTYIN